MYEENIDLIHDGKNSLNENNNWSKNCEHDNNNSINEFDSSSDIHELEGAFKCSECAQKLSSESNLKVHLSLIHEISFLSSNLQDVDKIEEKRCIQEDQCEIQNLSDPKSPKIDEVNEILVEKWPFLCINWNQIQKPNNQNPK